MGNSESSFGFIEVLLSRSMTDSNLREQSLPECCNHPPDHDNLKLKIHMMRDHQHQSSPDKTEAGNSSHGICRVISGCQRAPALPFGLPSASYVAPLNSRSPSPDPRRYKPPFLKLTS